MNIFAFDPCPYKSALWLDDIRKNKMITETCQILSTCMNVLDPNHGIDVFKSFNPKHGSNVWCMQSYENFIWLLNYVKHLHSQRSRPHKCERLFPFFTDWVLQNKSLFGRTELTPFSNNAANASVGVSYKHVQDTCLAYKMYINDRWKTDVIKLSWAYGQEPKWKGKL